MRSLLPFVALVTLSPSQTIGWYQFVWTFLPHRSVGVVAHQVHRRPYYS